MALLFTLHPGITAFCYPSFNSEAFHLFAATSTQIIAKAEQDACKQLFALSEHAETSFCGVIKTNITIFR